MELATQEMAEKNEQSEIVHDRNNNTNGVVITVYVESVTTRSEYPIKKTKTYPHGYDRRAQLLAHSRHLRNEGSENVPLPTNQSQTITESKQKGIRLTQPVRICSCYPSTHTHPCSSTRSRYERVASKSNGENSTTILSKVKKLLKELSCKEI